MPPIPKSRLPFAALVVGVGLTRVGVSTSAAQGQRAPEASPPRADRGTAPTAEKSRNATNARFPAETATPSGALDPWSLLSQGIHATQFGVSEGPGLEIMGAAIRVDTGMYRYDIPWSQVGFAYSVQPPDRDRPIVCIMPVDSRPICLGSLSFSSPDAVVASLNESAPETR